MSETKTITIKKMLETDTIKLGKKARGLLGKNVEIAIRVIDKPKPAEKKWRNLGSVSLGEKTDTINEKAFKFWKKHSLDMSNFKFDRSEANER